MLAACVEKKKEKGQRKEKDEIINDKKRKKKNNGESFKNLVLLISLTSLANLLKTWLGLTSLLNASACANQVI